MTTVLWPQDDLGTVVVCHGFLRGMMVSRLIDRPCGVGFIDLTKYTKFLTCGVDDARDVLGHDDFMEFGYTTFRTPNTPSIASLKENLTTAEMNPAQNTDLESGEGTEKDEEGPGEGTTSVSIVVSEILSPETENAPARNQKADIDKSK